MKREISLHLSLIFTVLFLWTTPASAQLPATMKYTYHGTVVDGTGSALNGTVTITFRIYDSASGGAVLWEEIQTTAVSGGKFTVDLGSIAPLNPGLFNKPLYLGIQVGGSSEYPERDALDYVPYSAWAGSSDNYSGPTVMLYTQGSTITTASSYTTSKCVLSRILTVVVYGYYNCDGGCVSANQPYICNNKPLGRLLLP